MSKPPTYTGSKQRRSSGAQRSQAAGRYQRKRRFESHEEHVLIYGIHAVEAVLANPGREVHAIYLTRNARNRLADALQNTVLEEAVEVEPKELDRRLGADTVHQGALVKCGDLIEPALDELIAVAKAGTHPIVVLDQITDPHNVGAVLRSCAVFGCAGVVMTRRHSPPLCETVAKSASGALELVPVALIQNLAKGLAVLAGEGLEIIGLDGAGEGAIETAFARRPTAIVLGAEGRGLRQSTRQACTAIVRIHAQGLIASLNVSNAAAVALHTHALVRQGVIPAAADD